MSFEEFKQIFPLLCVDNIVGKPEIELIEQNDVTHLTKTTLYKTNIMRKRQIVNNLQLENGRSMAGGLTAQSAIRPSFTKKTLHTCEITTQVGCNAACV